MSTWSRSLNFQSLIWTLDFWPAKLPGLSRKGPQGRFVSGCKSLKKIQFLNSFYIEFDDWVENIILENAFEQKERNQN